MVFVYKEAFELWDLVALFLMGNRRVFKLDDGLIVERPRHLQREVFDVEQPTLPSRLGGARWDERSHEVLQCMRELYCLRCSVTQMGTGAWHTPFGTL